METEIQNIVDYVASIVPQRFTPSKPMAEQILREKIQALVTKIQNQ